MRLTHSLRIWMQFKAKPGRRNKTLTACRASDGTAREPYSTYGDRGTEALTPKCAKRVGCLTSDTHLAAIGRGAAGLLLFGMALIPAPDADAASASLDLSSPVSTVSPGETFTVTVRASSPQEYDRARASLPYYGGRFRLIRIESGGSAFEKTLAQGVVDAGSGHPYDCLTLDRKANEPLTGANTVARLTFRVSSTAPGGTYSLGQEGASACTSGIWKGDQQLSDQGPGRIQITIKDAAGSGSETPLTPPDKEPARPGESQATIKEFFGGQDDATQSSSSHRYERPTLDELLNRTGGQTLLGSILGAVMVGALVIGWIAHNGVAKKS